MRFAIIAAAIVALALVGCNGPEKPTAGTHPEDDLVQTSESMESSPTGGLRVFKSSRNTLIETPEYTGVIFSQKRASEFSFLFDTASTSFWEPSVNDVSRAEACIKQHLESVRDDTKLGAYPQADAAFILENLEQYRRQYVGIVVNGEKRIWTNSFLPEDTYPDWERHPVYVLDGGNHYWEIEYVLSTDECIDFYVHGEA